MDTWQALRAPLRWQRDPGFGHCRFVIASLSAICTGMRACRFPDGVVRRCFLRWQNVYIDIGSQISGWVWRFT